MSGSMPEPEVVTASTGMSWIGQARVVRALELEDRLRPAALTFFASAGFVGPRFANVVPGGVVGRRGRRRALVEVLRARERLRGELRADDLAVRP